MIWPMLLLGVLPLVSGLSKFARSFFERRREAKSRPAELEREILEQASRLGGHVTVVQLATRTGRSLDEVSAALDEMTAKGYVVQNILENGVIQYDFPSIVSD